MGCRDRDSAIGGVGSLLDLGLGFSDHFGWPHRWRAVVIRFSSRSFSSGLETIVLILLRRVEMMPIFCLMW
jgi:hypothetical protein